jgi:hypothetical protein
MAKFPIVPADRPKPAAPVAVASPSIAEAVAGERLRVAGILESAEAAARPAAARRIALHTGMQVDEALAFLSSLPAEPSANDRLASLFVNAMGDAAPALAVAPGLTPGAVVEDKRARRLAEIKAAGDDVAVAKGYRRRTEPKA